MKGIRVHIVNKIDMQTLKQLTIIKDGNDQDHKRWEVELPYQCNKQKSELQWFQRVRINMDVI